MPVFRKHGFTLIELSIVLVIIGLIVGGIMVGRDLIAAAAVRAQVSQIETYKTAANTFRTKYGYLPGDIPAAPAAGFGFVARGTGPGQGDGNDILEGNVCTGAGCNAGTLEGRGEVITFWMDLSSAGLIEGTFNSGSSTVAYNFTSTSSPSLSDVFPQGKIGQNTYLLAFSGGAFNPPWSNWKTNGFNYIELQTIGNNMNSGWALAPDVGVNVGLTTQQAQNIDIKVDDGYPQTGNVLAQMIWNQVVWAAANSQIGASVGGNAATGVVGTPTTASVAGSANTCYDNRSTTGQPQQYSTQLNNGNNKTCALAFRFQ